MPFEGDTSRIEARKKMLDSKEGASVRPEERTPLKEFQPAAPEEWSHKWRPDFEDMSGGRESNFLKNFLIFSIVFFAASVALSAYLFLGGGNIISSRNVEVAISGPLLVAGGDELNIDIAVANLNSASLEFADLVVEFPEGTRSATGAKEDLPRLRQSLGTIEAGKVVKRPVKAVIFGEEGDELAVKATVEYRVAGSNAIFYSEGEHRVTIGSSPINLSVSSPREVSSGEEVEMIAVVASNSTSPINNILLNVEYPFGFVYKSAEPSPQFGQSGWLVGALQPKEKKQIKIRGLVSAEDNEERTVRFTAGIQSSSDEEEIGTPLVAYSESFLIRRPSLSMSLSLDGESLESFVKSAGSYVNGSVLWDNNTAGRLENISVELKLSGGALDRSSVSAQGGFFRSVDNTIVWDKNTNDAFTTVSPGDSGTLSFQFASLDPRTKSLPESPSIKLEGIISGRRAAESGGVDENIFSAATREVKIASNLSLSSRLVYSSGPFKNTGPVPPTVIWSITNSLNGVSGVKVLGSLPSYVSWLGAVSGGENVSFNQNTREVLWNAGAVAASKGLQSGREAAFQVSFLPSLSQAGSMPVILSGQVISGTDTFTGASLKSSVGSLTSSLSTDPDFSAEDGRVIQ